MFSLHWFVVAVDAMTKISEVGSNQDNDVAETNAHGLICLAAQLALEVNFHVTNRWTANTLCCLHSRSEY